MKICIITSTRADFGLLKNLISIIKNEKKFDLKVIATGTHFSKKYGYTYNEIIENKIKIYKKIQYNLFLDHNYSISKIFSKCVTEISKEFNVIKPDLLIILGDRYEIFASAVSAHLCRIPIAHIHGGEVTRGVIDDAFRHSITKMSHFHFVSNKIYKKRVAQLGENPKYIFTVGGLGLDSINNTPLLSRKELEKKFKFRFNKKNFLVSFHPETINKDSSKKQVNELLEALKTFKDTSFFFSMPGADLDNQNIISLTKKFVKNNKSSIFFKSLGQVNYFSFLKQVDGIIGNSSSGLLEMPFFKKGTVNIGQRQQGRLLSQSVINVAAKKKNIILAIKKILSDKFKNKLKKKNHNPYGKPGAAKKIVQILKKIKIEGALNKPFFDKK